MRMSRAIQIFACVIALAVVFGAAAALATAPATNGRIAFHRDDGTPRSGSIYTIAPDGSGERRVTRPAFAIADVAPDWSPDGSRIVFERSFDGGSPEIWTVRPDGSGARHLEPGCPPGIPLTRYCADELDPAWSPDGRRLAFAWEYGLKQVRSETWNEVGAIAIMDADGKNVRALTQQRRPTSAEDSRPAWSPDGKQIAFVREHSTAHPIERTAIFVMNVNRTGLRRITPWRLDAAIPIGRPTADASCSARLTRSPAATSSRCVRMAAG